MLCRIGEVEIWRVLESVCRFSPVSRFFPALSAADLAAHRWMAEPAGFSRDAETGEDWLVLPIQAFLLRTPESLILVDACVGNDKTLPGLAFWDQNRSGRFMAALAAAGARPEDVTHVMCTHLHVDHVGWTTLRADGRWVPTFPNASVLATAADIAHARQNAELRPDGVAGNVWRESIAPVEAAGRLEVVAPDHRIDGHVRCRHTPGHTPGHVSVEIAAPAGRVPRAVAAGGAITGDLIHSPLQCALPELSSAVDADGALAATTRRAYLESVASSGQLVIGSHFPLPSVGHVRAGDKGFSWQALLG